MKLKYPDCPIYFYPNIHSSLTLTGNPVRLKCEKSLDILKKSGNVVLVHWPDVGFAWVDENDLID